MSAVTVLMGTRRLHDTALHLALTVPFDKKHCQVMYDTDCSYCDNLGDSSLTSSRSRFNTILKLTLDLNDYSPQLERHCLTK